jgi:hypothetical protein
LRKRDSVRWRLLWAPGRLLVSRLRLALLPAARGLLMR